MNKTDFIFLGTGSGNGVPVFYCDCPVCSEAYEKPHCRRTRSAVSIEADNTYLIDTPPEISSQLIREKIGKIDRLFLTHAHHDHCAGLGDLKIYAKYFLDGHLPVTMSPQTLNDLEQIYGSMDDWMDVALINPNQKQEYADVSFTGLEVSHSPGALGYLIEFEGERIGYLPDTGRLPEATMALLKGVDTRVIDSTFHGENWFPDQHLTISDAIDVAQELEVGKLYLTHLSMHYSTPVTSAEIEDRIKQYEGRVNLAYDGLRLPLN